MQNRGNRRQAGFTLVELVTVVAIVMVLAGFAVISTFTTTQNSKANAASQAVVSQLRAARQMSISLRRNVLVTFTLPNKIQLAVETLAGETPATAIAPVYLNDNAAGGAQFFQFSSMPDTPMGFGNSSAITFQATSGGSSGLSVMYSSSGSMVGTTATSGFSSVGNSNPVNASIFIGFPGQPSTARAITVLGSTGRVRSYYWVGPSSGGTSTNWNE
jgi:prepilin-type N-terminal cleavage/methylation domain-containing protein